MAKLLLVEELVAQLMRYIYVPSHLVPELALKLGPDSFPA
jgi:hypothetical protein